MGKGYAVRYGMKRATGDVIGFIDADTDIQIRTLGYALEAIKHDSVMAVVPSKFHKDSNVEMKLGRKILSYGLMYTNRFLLKLPKNVDDVGCGLKLFRKELIERILPFLKINNFAIDSEILNFIDRVGYSVSVIPFFLNKKRSESTSANLKETLRMLKDIFHIAIINKTSVLSNIEIQLVKLER